MTAQHTDPGRLCRSAAVRVPAGSDHEPVRRRLVAELAGRPADGYRCWVEEVGPAQADLRRERELARPVDTRFGPAVRTVLLRHPDGAADLVVVAHRPDAAPPPPPEVPGWLCGPAGSDTDRLVVDLPAVSTAHLLAALGLVLARYTGHDAVSIGLLDRPAVSLNIGRTLGDLLAAAGAVDADGDPTAGAARPSASERSLVGLAVADDGWFRPFLAPVWPLSIVVAGTAATVTWWSTVDAGSVEWFVHRWMTALHALVTAAPDAPAGDVEVLDAEDRRAVAALGGAGGEQPGRPGLVHQAVAAAAARTPDARAVGLDGRGLTYRALDERANRVAHALQRKGIGPGSRVGVCLERGTDLVVVLLGVLKSGAAYVPMDPDYPAERLAFIAQDAGLATVVTEAPTGPGSVDPGTLLAAGTVTAPDSGVTPDDPAYVIYTSGSTGVPKGVVVPHRNVTRLLAAAGPAFAFGPHDVWTWFHSAAFDFSVWEIWGCLMTGGRLVVVPYQVSRSPERFAALLATEQVTVLNQTPSAFSQLLDVDRDRPLPESLRLVVFGGEPLDTAPLLGWFDRHPERSCRLVNMYGITETTVHVTAQPLTRAEALAGSPSVGHPLPGWHVYVLDGRGRLVPPGVPGEIYVGGCGVAGAYLNRPELTAQRFRPDPYAPGLMYRTGDRGRLLPDGRLEHLGRLDSQVQLRGHRVEPGEVRARLLDAPGVRAAAVVPRVSADDPLAARLDAYVVGDVDPDEVRRHAARFLPDYMLPATVTVLPALPLTANGKVDTARLRPPSTVAAASRPGGGDGGLLAVWEQVFGFRVEPDDDFFALGGNSLLAVRLLDGLSAIGIELSVPQLYRSRTVRQLAALLPPVRR